VRVNRDLCKTIVGIAGIERRELPEQVTSSDDLRIGRSDDVTGLCSCQVFFGRE